MASSIKNVVVVGGTGQLGAYIVQALLDADFTVTVLSRPGSEASTLPGAKLVKTAYTVPDLSGVLRGKDAVVCALGPAALLDQLPIIDAAAEVGVKRYVAGEFGPAREQAGIVELEYSRVSRYQVMEHLIAKCEEKKGLTWSAVAVGNFFDWAIKKFPQGMGFQVATRTARLIDSGNEPFTGTNMAGIAQSIVGIMQHPSETANRFLKVRSLETTQLEVLAAFEEVTGEKWARTYISSKELLEEGRRKLAAGEKGATLDLVCANLFTEGAGRSIVATREGSDNKLLGVREEKVVDVVRRIVDELGN